jgi:enoyl-CoA hydratase/carnithine racemase
VGKTLDVTIDDGLATVRLQRENGNAINGELAVELLAATQEIAADPQAGGMLLAASGKLFGPGLDLLELIELDRPGLERFLHKFNATVLTLYEFPKPLVAAIHSHAVAGSCVITLPADRRILRRGAKIGLNEVRVGLPLPYGISTILRQTVNPTWLEPVALLGLNFTDDNAMAAGLAHELHDAEGFEEHCKSRLRELTERDPGAFRVTKRYLRSAAIERIRANDPQLTVEFLDVWFAPATQQRLQGIVQGLRERD